MIKVIFSCLIFFCLCGYARSSPADRLLPGPDTFHSNAVYISSNTAINSTEVVISTNLGFLHAVNVNTPGSGSKLEIWDGRVSTNTAIKKIANIDTTSKVSLIYNIGLSSGIVIFNQGTTPADVTITYREKGW